MGVAAEAPPPVVLSEQISPEVHGEKQWPNGSPYCSDLVTPPGRAPPPEILRDLYHWIDLLRSSSRQTWSEWPRYRVARASAQVWSR